jgi:hypothetical protein
VVNDRSVIVFDSNGWSVLGGREEFPEQKIARMPLKEG